MEPLKILLKQLDEMAQDGIELHPQFIISIGIILSTYLLIYLSTYLLIDHWHRYQ